MQMLARAALLLSAALGAASAATSPAATVRLPQCLNANGSNVPCQGAVLVNPGSGDPVTPANPLPATDAANASFTFAPAGGAAESSTASSYTFSTASQSLARGWYANCPANTAIVVTLSGVNGGSAPRTLYDGWQDGADRLAGYSGNSAGCTIGERF